MMLAQLRRAPLTLMGMATALAVVVVALMAPVLAPYSPSQPNPAQRLQPPSLVHPMGTDELGRDILSRVIWGARASVGAGVLVTVIAAAVGLLIGSAVGYLGGWVDALVMRIMDIILSFPSLVLAMALAAALGPSFTSAMLAVAFVRTPLYTRLARGQALSLRERDFVRAARTFGSSNAWIILRHILPDTVPTIVVQATLGIGEAVLIASSLSFIGLGAQPPMAEWGAMVATGRRFLLEQWWLATFPGLAIFITTIAFNLAGDGLRDLLDPRGVARRGDARASAA